ncbi:MAG: peptide ABC transporter substrate-binding protein [Chloroflexota bacterium]
MPIDRRSLLAAFAAAGLAAPFLAGAAAAAERPALLRVAKSSWPTTIDPQQISWVDQSEVVLLDYEGLTRLDSSLLPRPGAAESWTASEDGRTLTFTLREGLTYRDGTPLTAERFVFAFRRATDPAVAAELAGLLFVIKGAEQRASGDAAADLGVRALDDRTVEFRLTRRAPYFPAVASLPIGFPVMEESLAGGPGWEFDPARRIGNGRFALDRVERDQLLGYRPNERYWEGPPRLGGIEFRIVPDTAVAFEAFAAGALDIAALAPQQVATALADAALAPRLISAATASTLWLTMNNAAAPFDDPKVREAFARGLDRETLCQDLLGGSSRPATGAVPPGIAGHIDSPSQAFDPGAARAALAASTYGGPGDLPEIRLLFVNEDSAAVELVEWIAGNYRDVLGVELILDGRESSSFISAVSSPETFPQIATLGWFADYADPQDFIELPFACGGAWAVNAGFCLPDLDAAIAAAEAEPDPAARAAAYERAGELLSAANVVVFLTHPLMFWLVQPGVAGITPTGFDLSLPGGFGSLGSMTIGPAA